MRIIFHSPCPRNLLHRVSLHEIPSDTKNIPTRQRPRDFRTQPSRFALSPSSLDIHRHEFRKFSLRPLSQLELTSHGTRRVHDNTPSPHPPQRQPRETNKRPSMSCPPRP